MWILLLDQWLNVVLIKLDQGRIGAFTTSYCDEDAELRLALDQHLMDSYSR
jgi:hypothetical protein